MTDDILAGIRTAIDHGAKALMPAIDRMIEWADTLDGSERTTALRQAELLRWMMANVEWIDTAGVLRTRCEFPTDDVAASLDYLFRLRFKISTMDICDALDDIEELSDYSVSDTCELTTTLAAWVGGNCNNCSGKGSVEDIDSYRSSCRCPACDGSGRVNAIGPRAVLAAPIRELVLESIATISTPHSKQWIIVDDSWSQMPNMICRTVAVDGIRVRYPTREAARAAVSTVALNWARRQAGMQHDIEGRRFER